MYKYHHQQQYQQAVARQGKITINNTYHWPPTRQQYRCRYTGTTNNNSGSTGASLPLHYLRYHYYFSHFLSSPSASQIASHYFNTRPLLPTTPLLPNTTIASYYQLPPLRQAIIIFFTISSRFFSSSLHFRFRLH